MSAFENFKNFLRHGKQARGAHPQPADPTTDVSPVHAQQQRYHEPQVKHLGISEPAPVHAHIDRKHHGNAGQGDYSVANVDNRNVAAQVGGAAANAAGENQRLHGGNHADRKKEVDPAVIERIVAEERESKGKLPKYPGLERYRLIEKMGDGAFSNVYRARDTTGEFDEVAIKVVRKFEMNASQRANILKEVQIMRQLDHPNIVKLVSFSESTQYYFIVLELCPGGELFHQIVRLTYFSEDLSRHVILQVAKALLYLHEEKGVVHRDIKPENLLFYPIPFIPTKNPKPRAPEDEEKEDEGEFVAGVGSGGIGQIKIADFGLSKVVWDSQTMTPCGTVGYTAPEIVKDERYSKSVDMWALGCVLYTLLCGFPPFYDESIQVLTEKVARGQYTFLSPWWDDISKGAQDLVSHLLTVDPEKRYTIEQFLNHPWIRNTNEATTAAADAPPLATPLYTRQKEYDFNKANSAAGGSEPLSAQFLETPGGHMRRMDFRSPGAVNLREVFDVGYAVHRQEEEGKRRKNFKQGYRGGGGINGLNALDEDNDDDELDDGNDTVAYRGSRSLQDPPAKLPKSHAHAHASASANNTTQSKTHAHTAATDVSGMEMKMRNAHLGNNPSAAAQARASHAPPPQQSQPKQERGYGQHSPAVAAAARQQVRKKQGPFELSLDNATLLGRRGKAQGQESKLREQIVR